MKILIVDDEPLVRKSLVRVLRSRGHDVMEAEDGRQGLELWLTGEGFDLVILDVLMPHRSGPEVIHDWREKMGSQTVQAPKIVLISAFSGEHRIGSGTEPGPKVDLFISKPFDDIFLVASQLEALLEKRN